jgi:hypothetical protein
MRLLTSSYPKVKRIKWRLKPCVKHDALTSRWICQPLRNSRATMRETVLEVWSEWHSLPEMQA